LCYILLAGQLEIDDGLGQRLDQRNIVVGVVFAREGVQADAVQFVPLLQADTGVGVGAARAVEGVQHMLVLIAVQAVGLGHDGINGGAHVPAFFFGCQDGPGVSGVWLVPGVAKPLLPQRGVSGVVGGAAHVGVSSESAYLGLFL